jgi:hypothetical protein
MAGMERYKFVISDALFVVACGLLSAYLLYHGDAHDNGGEIFIGLIWLAYGVISAVRTVRKYKKIKTSNENCLINGGEKHE